MRGKRRPQSERIRALSIAAVEGSQTASDMTGIPPTTIQTWMERPEFAALREKTREDLAEGFRALAHLAMTKLMEAMKAGQVEPRDLAVALGIATDKHLLMSGEATSRSESRAWTDDLQDDEKQRLREWIDSLDSATPAGPGEAPADSEPAGAEVRQPAAG